MINLNKTLLWRLTLSSSSSWSSGVEFEVEEEVVFVDDVVLLLMFVVAADTRAADADPPAGSALSKDSVPATTR